MASRYTTAYISSNSRDCHSRTTGMILSVVRLIILPDTSTPHMSLRCLDILSAVFPLLFTFQVNNLWRGTSLGNLKQTPFFFAHDCFSGFSFSVFCIHFESLKRASRKVQYMAESRHDHYREVPVHYKVYIISSVKLCRKLDSFRRREHISVCSGLGHIEPHKVLKPQWISSEC